MIGVVLIFGLVLITFNSILVGIQVATDNILGTPFGVIAIACGIIMIFIAFNKKGVVN